MRFALFLLLLLVSAPLSAAELVLFDESRCPLCQAWHRDVGPDYASSPEAARAPLRQMSVHSPMPRDLRGLAYPCGTPTFVLVDGGREIGRIEGYRGADAFWADLRALIARLP
ncbi:MAG: thioredoxin family protein [Pseudomonadota bacterium]